MDGCGFELNAVRNIGCRQAGAAEPRPVEAAGAAVKAQCGEVSSGIVLVPAGLSSSVSSCHLPGVGIPTGARPLKREARRTDARARGGGRKRGVSGGAPPAPRRAGTMKGGAATTAERPQKGAAPEASDRARARRH